MIKELFLIYIDILGFEKKPKLIFEDKGIKEKEVRSIMLKLVKDCVVELRNKSIVIKKKRGLSDDLILVVKSKNDLIRTIASILELKLPYPPYDNVSFEIGVGKESYDEETILDIEDLIVKNSTIALLKNNIIGYYRKIFFEEKSESPKDSFVVITNETYASFEPFEKKLCSLKMYQKNEEKSDFIKFYSIDPLNIINKNKMLIFLEKIGHSKNKWYERVEDIYISPDEYINIKATLREKKIVFITGTPEFGKTYTAVRLMWEFFNEGYGPKWITGGELIERNEVRKKLENIDSELKSNTIIYYEDPFGKTKYEKRESLERDIGIILDKVSSTTNSFVIITAREEIYKEFLSHKISSRSLEDFERSLNIKKPSYNIYKRKEMLCKWAEEMQCKWFENKELKDRILWNFLYEKILPTPLSIRNFAYSTVNKGTYPEVIEELEIQSGETAKVFANEIKNMTEDKILFLSFVFIANLKYEFAKENYYEMIKELQIVNSWGFDQILDWFNNDKINIIEHGNEKYIVFSHPSYSETLPYILIENGFISSINKRIFSKVLTILEDKEPFVLVGKLFDFIDFIDISIRDRLLYKFSTYGGIAWYIARQIAQYFWKKKKVVDDWKFVIYKLCEDERFALLFLKEIDRAIDHMPLPFFLQKSLLYYLSNRGIALKGVCRVLTKNYDKLPAESKILINSLINKKECASYIAASIIRNFNKLPEEIREKIFYLAENEDATKALSLAFYENFLKIPKDFSKKLMNILSISPNGSTSVATIIYRHFESFDKDFRNQILKNLLNERNSIGGVLKIITKYYDKIPEKICNHLKISANQEDQIGKVSWALRENFGFLPKNFREEILLKLSSYSFVSWNVLVTIFKDYNSISTKTIRKILLTKIENEAVNIANLFELYFSRISLESKEFLFTLLIEQNETSDILTNLLINNYNSLPKKVKHRTLEKLLLKERDNSDIFQLLNEKADTLPKYLRKLL